MGYRDELSAAQARADALQRRVDELEAENAALHAAEAGDAGPADVAGAVATSAGAPPTPGADATAWRAAATRTVLLPALVLVAAGGALFGAHQPALGGVVAAVGVTLAAAGAVVVSLVELIPPGSILVITGRPRPGPDGRPRGFRIVTGGRVIRMPLVEQAQHLDVRPRAIPVRVAGAYSRGGVPLEVDAIAQVRLASREPRVTHAVERFLGADRARVDEVAREILQGHLRELIARLTPAEAREDVVPLGRALAEKAEADLGRCGIEIDRAELVDIVGGA